MTSLEAGHRARKYAEEIRNAGFQATGVVRQMLAFSRPGTSSPRLLSLNEIVDGMKDLLTRLIGESIELRFHLDPNLGLVRMDTTQVQQVLLNLVLNARDALPRGGQVRVETGNRKVQILPDAGNGNYPIPTLSCALFVVSDNGQGMDDDTRSHLFEPFFTTMGGKGTGLAAGESEIEAGIRRDRRARARNGKVVSHHREGRKQRSSRVDSGRERNWKRNDCAVDSLFGPIPRQAIHPHRLRFSRAYIDRERAVRLRQGCLYGREPVERWVDGHGRSRHYFS